MTCEIKFLYLGSKQKTSGKGNVYSEVSGIQDGELIRLYYPISEKINIKEMTNVIGDLEIINNSKFTNIKLISLMEV